MKISLPSNSKDYLTRSAAIALKREVFSLLEDRFEEVKKEMVEEFLNHPVTKEIMLGPNVKDNPSGLLGGYGGLFSFIGFVNGDDPITPIIEMLKSSSLEIGRPTIDGMEYKVKMPSAAEIFKATPMPWASGRSWAKGIESGISGLGYYLNTHSEASLSKEGLQISVKLRGGSFKKTKYISDLINRYSKRFQKLL